MKQYIDLFIENPSFILTMNKEREILQNFSIAVDKGKIIAIGETESLLSKFQAQEHILAHNQLLMPGLINTHTHHAMSLYRGYANDLPVITWLHDHIWPLEGKTVNKDMVSLGVELALCEMIKFGATSFNDMYFYVHHVAELVEKIGVRSFIGEGVIDFPTPFHKTSEAALKYVEETMQTWRNHPFITITSCVHAPYTAEINTLQQAKKLSERYNTPFHVHVAESDAETQIIQEKYHTTPVQHMERIGVLDSNLIAAHSIHLDNDDLQLYQKRGVHVSHIPESNMKLASGFARIPEMLEMGVNVTLGTDGPASNNELSLFSTMRMAALIHKGYQKDCTVVKAQEVVEMATINGAKALGVADKIGSIEVGKEADLILLNLNQPHLKPLYDIYAQLVYAAQGSDVTTTIVQGKVLMKDKQLLTLDEARILAQAQEFAEIVKREFHEKAA